MTVGLQALDHTSGPVTWRVFCRRASRRRPAPAHRAAHAPGGM